MLLEKLKVRVTTIFDSLLPKWSNNLPFKGRYLRAVRDAILSQIEAMQGQWQAFFAKEGEFSDADAFVDYLIDQIKDKIKLPFPAKLILYPMRGQLIESLREYLKENLYKVRDTIGLGAG
jgi:hypothetical protein